MRRVVLPHQAFSSPVNDLPAFRGRRESRTSKPLLVPQVYDFVLTDATNFVVQGERSTFRPCPEPAVNYAASHVEEALDGMLADKTERATFQELVGGVPCEGGLPLWQPSPRTRAVVALALEEEHDRNEEEGIVMLRQFASLAKLSFEDFRATHRDLAGIGSERGLLGQKGDWEEGSVTLSDQVGMQRVELQAADAPGPLKASSPPKRSLQILAEAIGSEGTPLVRDNTVRLVCMLETNLSWQQGHSSTLGGPLSWGRGALSAPQDGQGEDFLAVLQRYEISDEMGGQAARSDLESSNPVDVHAAILEEDPLPPHPFRGIRSVLVRQESKLYTDPVQAIQRGGDLLKGVEKTLPADHACALPPFLVDGASLSDNLCKDVFLACCESPYIGNRSRPELNGLPVLGSWSKSLRSTGTMDFCQKMASPSRAMMYLDWSLIEEHGRDVGDGGVLECFETRTSSRSLFRAKPMKFHMLVRRECDPGYDGLEPRGAGAQSSDAMTGARRPRPCAVSPHGSLHQPKQSFDVETSRNTRRKVGRKAASSVEDLDQKNAQTHSCDQIHSNSVGSREYSGGNSFGFTPARDSDPAGRQDVSRNHDDFGRDLLGDFYEVEPPRAHSPFSWPFDGLTGTPERTHLSGSRAQRKGSHVTGLDFESWIDKEDFSPGLPPRDGKKSFPARHSPPPPCASREDLADDFFDSCFDDPSNVFQRQGASWNARESLLGSQQRPPPRTGSSTLLTGSTWDSSKILENWNAYRRQRHFAENSQTFVSRKRRKRTRSWGVKRI
ncbi:hypothetical protein HOP50_04g28450 [Chloropicon primus]|nr:hypothetical protein HOP50_04g28450 [Chloropicon primus]